jgi:hypothetical protein
MHQNVRKNGVVIVSNIAESETYPLPGKSPTFYITNQFCRVRYIERLLYTVKFHKKPKKKTVTVLRYFTFFFKCFLRVFMKFYAFIKLLSSPYKLTTPLMSMHICHPSLLTPVLSNQSRLEKSR